MRKHTLLLLPALAVALASCSDPSDDWGPDELARGKSVSAQVKLDRGRDAYTTYCVGCHGEAGDGSGPAARFLEPKPRDLRKGKIKFAAVAAGEMPRDEDLVRVITTGLHGTSMPSWNLLPREVVLDLVAYIKTFTPDRKPAGAAVTIPPDPWTKKPDQGVAEGERVYHGIASCMNCHPAYAPQAKIVEHMKGFDIPFTGFRERLYESETKDSEWGAPIRPPDFWVDPVKSGSTKEDLVRTIAAGVGGTAMPSWAASLPPKQLWGLAYYVESLVKARGTAEAKTQKAALLGEPKLAPPPAPPPEPASPEAPIEDAGAPDGGAK